MAVEVKNIHMFQRANDKRVKLDPHEDSTFIFSQGDGHRAGKGEQGLI